MLKPNTSLVAANHDIGTAASERFRPRVVLVQDEVDVNTPFCGRTQSVCNYCVREGEETEEEFVTRLRFFDQHFESRLWAFSSRARDLRVVSGAENVLWLCGDHARVTSIGHRLCVPVGLANGVGKGDLVGLGWYANLPRFTRIQRIGFTAAARASEFFTRTRTGNQK